MLGASFYTIHDKVRDGRPNPVNIIGEKDVHNSCISKLKYLENMGKTEI